jgi:hypothetical protein
MTNAVFCDVVLCSLVDVSRRLGGQYSLHLQDRRASQASKNHVASVLFRLRR